MNDEFAVAFEHVDKIYHTHNFFLKEDDGKRKLHVRKTVHAVKGVEFGVRRGEILGLLGPNGAGKTTCVKMISGLVRPTAGKVFVNGMHVEKRRRRVLRDVGVVLEGTRTVIWPLTPLENLKYFGRLRDVRGKVLTERSKELLTFIGLKDKMHTQVRRLSRGQRQRLAICISLIADPAVILLDEPTTGLDVQSSRAIRERIRHMTRELGKSVLVTTHDMHVAQEICDRIGIVDNGELITCRPTSELLSVFADQTFEFRLDRMPSAEDFENIPGVHAARVESNGASEDILVLQVSDQSSERSEALYAAVEKLRREGYALSSISQRQQTLENVFVRLTQSTL
jgi:ABC-2 type transport system ATP-binding protein